MIGDTISHYLILERLGGGGMGVVYRAEDTRLGRSVALKFLPHELTGDPEARGRFNLEARAASALDHANICTIYDIDETDDGQLFIAMAFYPGETLKARLSRGPIGIDEALVIARQVGAGLERAHEEGIVHRDIKPANLMVTERGEVKILDFGVAKLVGQEGLTTTGSSVGTLAYMSPEQIEGGDVGPAADCWALGVVLYEMLVGSRPFGGDRKREVLSAILALDPKAPSADRTEIPQTVDALVLELLQKDPEQRPESEAVLQRVTELAEARAVPTAALLRRPTVWVAAAAAVATIAAAIFVPAARRAEVDAARAMLPQIQSLHADRRYAEAYALALEAEDVLGADSSLVQLIRGVSDVLTVRTDPPGAQVSIQGDAGGASSDPVSIGTTPIVSTRLPRGDHVLTISADGYRPVERLVSSALLRVENIPRGLPFEIEVDLELPPIESSPEDAVHVPPGAYTLVSADAPAGASADVGGFFMDRYEVTNAEYLEFVQAGGYADRSLWLPLLERDGTDGSSRRAIELLLDRTSLPGPRGWTGQRFPEGMDRHPVTTVSWYEAAAYCEWRGKSLPTLFEWEKAARGGAFTHIEGVVLPWGLVEPGATVEGRANFSGSGTVEVDAQPMGMSPYGAHAMAGNVREWTETEAEAGFIAMGGSWQDPVYVFSSIATPDPLFADPGLGFRCVLRQDEAAPLEQRRIELARRSPSYEPVDEATYRSFLAHYRYDPVDLDPEIVETIETEDWTRIKVRFNGLGGDPVLAYLYLPARGTPPYQTVVILPGNNVFFAERISDAVEWGLGANIRAGRAAFGIVLDGMVERQRPAGSGPPASNTVEFRNLMVRHSTELSLGLDYLETRNDIDMDKLAYLGVSWGAGSRSVLAAIDDRWDAVIFMGGGIDERLHPTVPEALNVNFLPYIQGPKLLLNGRQDEEHPWLTRALPLWELWSEPKELVLLDHEGHIPSLEARVPAINGFLNRVFGPVR
ncbi:MAG: protein kinase domain-containing protein [Longimicrobiales bacterium]